MRTILCKDLSHNQARKSYSLFSMALEPPALGANGIRIKRVRHDRAFLPWCGREFASLRKEYRSRVTLPRWSVTLHGPAYQPPAQGGTVLFDLRPVKEKPPGGGFSIHRAKPFSSKNEAPEPDRQTVKAHPAL